MWGYASQPLIDGEKLYVIVGGPGSHCVALHKDTGDEIWRTGTAPEQGYSPPLLIRQAGTRQLILSSPDAIYAVDPDAGKILWSRPYGADFGSIIMTPIHMGNYVYTGGYGNKNLMLELAEDKPGAKTLWRDDPKRGVSAQNVQPFLMDSHIYGIDHNGEFRCFEVPSGKVVWLNSKLLGDRKLVSGSIFLVRQHQTDKFWMFSETGDLIIAQLSPKGYSELSRMHVIDPSNHAFGRDVVWCAPAYANKRMYVRNDKELVCIDLAK
jgi:outer membrane protein assembly factor BamB